MRIRGVHSVRAKGKLYYYAWRGGPRVIGEPGTPEFIASLAAAHATRTASDGRTIAGLCTLYRADRAYLKNADKTRKEWARWLDRIQLEFGKAPIKDFDLPAAVVGVGKWRSKYASAPRSADVGLEVMSRLLSFGCEQGLLINNPCKHVKRLYHANRADQIWTDADLEKLEKRASVEVFQAARLAALTGLRRGDLLRLSWSHIKGNAIEIATGKSRRRKTTLIPIYAELRSLLDAIPKKATTILTNSAGLPWASGFGASWNKAKTGIALHFHDLRGTAATRFYLAGLSIREIAEIMTWGEARVEALINRYVKRDELLLDRIRRLDANSRKTKAVKPGVKQGPAS